MDCCQIVNGKKIKRYIVCLAQSKTKGIKRLGTLSDIKIFPACQVFFQAKLNKEDNNKFNTSMKLFF